MCIEKLIGKTIIRVTGCEIGSEQVTLICNDGTSFSMYHEQDCCESVGVDNIEGDLVNIINIPIVIATETSPNRPVVDDQYIESFTWTDFTITTIKGTVVFQWLGCSNGYYSETPVFKENNLQ